MTTIALQIVFSGPADGADLDLPTKDLIDAAAGLGYSLVQASRQAVAEPVAVQARAKSGGQSIPN